MVTQKITRASRDVGRLICVNIVKHLDHCSIHTFYRTLLLHYVIRGNISFGSLLNVLCELK